MLKIAILVSGNLLPGHDRPREDIFEFEEQFGKFIPAFAMHDMQAVPVLWDRISHRANEYNALLPLMVWDYFEGRQDTFLAEMERASAQSVVMNDPSILRWNADKSYLEDLARSGAPVIETILIDHAEQAVIDPLFHRLDTDKLVLKPRIGGGAWRQALYRRGAAFPDACDLPPGQTMVQAFLPSVVAEGEYSFLYFNGQFSHAVVKRPQNGDYRIQSIYGGTEASYKPTLSEHAVAEAVLECLDKSPLYARVDLLRGRDGGLKLIELEMIEPYLYFEHASGRGADNKGAQNLARAVKARLSRSVL